MPIRPNRLPMRAAAWAAAACATLVFSGQLAAQTPKEVAQKAVAPIVTIELEGSEMPESLRRTIEDLSKAGANVTIRPAPPAASAKPAPARAAGDTASGKLAEEATTTLEHVWDMFAEGFSRGNAAVPAIAGLPADFEKAWGANRNGLSGLNGHLRIFLALAGAMLAGWLAPRLIRPWVQRFGPRPLAGLPFSKRVQASLLRLGVDAVGLAAYLVTAALAVGALLPEPDIAQTTARLLSQSIGVTGIYLLAGRLLLAPGEPQFRLLALPRAEWHFRILMIYGFIGAFTITSIGLTALVASNPLAAAGWFTVWGALLMAMKVWWFWNARHDTRQLILSGAARPEAVSPSRQLAATLAPFALIASALAIWAVSRAAVAMADGVAWGRAAGLTQFMVVLVPILAEGATQFARCKRQSQSASVPPAPLTHAVNTVIERVAGAAVWIIGLIILGRVWSVYLLDAMSGGGNSLLSHLTAVAIVFGAGWIIFIFAKAFFDAYAPAHSRSLMPGAEDEGTEDHVPSRLATVLPVIRGVALGAVIGLTLLIGLSRLGIDTGPLVAGFGILGLAISFGSQALVRDIVSGMFFMIEDAFRVGEYIDTGKLKGTVEKISLRSIVLRHQSGQIHTVPFGQIASVTNASRDWATLKFNLRLDHSADIEKARKTIKKVGIAMAQDPELGPQIIMPLKMQGVSDITDNAVIVRLKFTARPAQASLMQRESLKRIYKALNEAGVPFATGAVTVRSLEERGLAGAAAAQSMAIPPALEPVG